MNNSDSGSKSSPRLRRFNMMSGIAALSALLSTLAFKVEKGELVWAMWRDNTTLAFILLFLGAASAAGWFVTMRRIRDAEETGTSFTSSKGTRLSSPYNIWKPMEPSTRRRLALAVFLTFSIIGPISLLMSSATQLYSLPTVVLKTLASGGMAASFILFGRKIPLLILSYVAFLALNMYVNPKISDMPAHTSPPGAQIVLSEKAQSDIEDQRGLLGISAILLLIAGYAMWIVVLNKEGNKRVRYQTEIGIAQDIQRKLLPSDVFRNSWVQAYGVTVPAEDVGGDYFDVIPISEHQLAIVVADVAGHGIGAGILSTMTKSALRSQLLHDHSPVAVLRNLNSVIYQIAERKTFVTLAYVLLDWKMKSAHIATAGHPPVFHHTTSNGMMNEVRTASMGLGMQENGMFSEAVLPIAAGDTLFLYTDGVVEASNEQNELFGMARLNEIVLKSGDASSREVTSVVMNAIKEFLGKKAAADDATVVCVKL